MRSCPRQNCLLPVRNKHPIGTLVYAGMDERMSRHPFDEGSCSVPREP